ncbi:hypothetical protein [Plantactinospora soyae]|uniref:Uncharacterized protein n=1 Tax=Plantactinospora soyae TaxID=1544732 RepID=A0A927M7U9_9ACTN|nr:hypothetical protein [Plantactinospora soyae]MBE1486100.1 hypothetical protein [Plantactinospora soyae]
MTGGPFREVDPDLLADYVGGALDGTPEEAELAWLIDEDPIWAEAYASLSAGIDAVRLDLGAWATEPISMPSAVTERLAAVITRASLPTETRPAAPETGSAAPDTSAGPTDAPDEDDADPDDSVPVVRRPRRSGVPVQAGGAAPHGSRGPGRQRRWMRRIAGPILVATVVAGFAGFAVSRLLLDSGAQDGATSTALSSADNGAEQPAPALGSGPPRAVTEPSAERVLTTGTDYNPTSLPDTASALTKRVTSNERAGATTPVTEAPGTMIDGGPTSATPSRSVSGLERLTDRTVLAACLDAIAARHAQGPIAVEFVDYATFQGTAALVVVFTDRSGARYTWATGPNCGTSASGADVTYQTRVG